MSDIEPFYPIPPRYVQHYVDALGTETAIEFLLSFGGAEIFLSDDPKGKGEVERVIGHAKAVRLSEVSDSLKFRVPLATAWLARCLYAQGLSIAAIARRLRRTDHTIRGYVKGQNMGRSGK